MGIMADQNKKNKKTKNQEKTAEHPPSVQMKYQGKTPEKQSREII